MGSWNSGFKKIAEMMPTAFRRNVAGFARVFTSPLQRAMQTCELAGFAARAAPCDPNARKRETCWLAAPTPETLLCRPGTALSPAAKET
jgi:hypothetical protein